MGVSDYRLLFGLYMQDYGGPVGNRIIGRHPEWLEWQVVQNSNAYEEGFTEVWDAFRHGRSEAFYRRKRAEGKGHHQAVIALARRRINVLWAMLRDGEIYREKPAQMA